MISKKTGFSLGQLLLNLLFIIISLAYVLPLLLLVSISISSENSIREFGYNIFPKVIDMAAYEQIFQSPQTLLDAYRVTIIFTIVTTVLSIVIMGMMAYPLSRKNCKMRNVVSFYIFFTMLFSGGLVPTYIIVSKYLHLNNTMWVYILPSLVNAWNIIIIRTYFQGLPPDLVEAAKIDGASETYILFKIIFPLSTPVFATIGFMVALGKWNDWNTSLIYIDDTNLYSLQYMLQRILREAEFLKKATTEANASNFINQEIPTESMRYAMAILAAGPMMFVFPFFQKYFTKGLTIGAVKG